MSEQKSTRSRPVLLLIPVALIASLVVAFIAIGPRGIFPGDFPPVEDLTIGTVDLEPGHIEFSVTNGGPSAVKISQVLIDDAFWEYEISPSPEIRRLRTANITVEYPWVETEPIAITVLTETGLTFSHDVEVATSTPAVDGRFLLTFALLGIYIGILPVAFGMAFIPFIRTLSKKWVTFLMAFAAGVLIFLGAETLVEAIESAEVLPTAIGGTPAVTFAAIVSFAVILAGSRMLRKRTSGDPRFIVALTVAAGIGLHNLGEGLAVGAAYRLGEIALGAFLVIGFALHNTTEGIGIVSIIGDRKTTLARLAVLGLVAGAPTILGGWMGAFFFSPTIAAFFLAVAAGAIAEVVFDVLAVIREEGTSLTAAEVLGGISAGVAVMYATSLLIAA